MYWIDALRPGCGLVTVLLTASGFNIVGQVVNPYLLLAIFCITSTAMLWNDLHDKEIDLGKGKSLASQQPKQFLFYSIFVTALSLLFSTLVVLDDLWSGLLCYLLLFISIIYNYIQNIPVVKNLSIALATGAVLLFPMFESEFNNTTLWTLMLLTILVIGAREYIKDVEDMEVDRGKKQTLALLIDMPMSDNVVRNFKLPLTVSIISLSLIGFLY